MVEKNEASKIRNKGKRRREEERGGGLMEGRKEDYRLSLFPAVIIEVVI